jgi:hypothetical protein
MSRKVQRLSVAASILSLVVGCSRLATGSTPAPQEGDVSPLPIPTESREPLPSVSASLPGADPSEPLPGMSTAFVECPVEGTLEISFVIPPGNDYKDHLPGMGASPELESKSGVLVNIYASPAKILNVSGVPGVPRPDSYNDVVCVVLPPDPADQPPDGEAIVYYDVSRVGFVPPPEAYVRYVVTTYLEYACRFQLPPCNPQRPPESTAP